MNQETPLAYGAWFSVLILAKLFPLLAGEDLALVAASHLGRNVNLLWGSPLDSYGDQRIREDLRS